MNATRHQIVFEDDLMRVMDDDGLGYDAHVLSQGGQADAERKIDEWSGEYNFDAADAKRDLRSFYEEENLFAKIAREVLKIETLEARKMDRLDFHEVSVWALDEALRRAYNAGREDANK